MDKLVRTTDKQAPLVSVIIPVYNQEKFIEDCVRSVLAQDFCDYEVVLVDDGSTDSTAKKLGAMISDDDRWHIISYGENRGTSQARKDAVLASSGKYVMFVDPDDTLSPTALSTAVSSIEKYGVDILQFGTEVISCGVNEGAYQRFVRDCEPYGGRINDKTLFFACFEDNLFNFNLWNKIYNGDMARRSFSMVKDGYFPKAQDMYAFLIMSYYSRSYASIGDKLYNYYFGRGITGKRSIPLTRFAKVSTQMHIIEELYRFFDIEYPKDITKYTDVLARRGNIFLSEVLANYGWIESLATDGKQATMLLLEGLTPVYLADEFIHSGVALSYRKFLGEALDRIYYESNITAPDLVYDFAVELARSGADSGELGSELFVEAERRLRLIRSEKPIIPVVFATNSVYASYLGVAIASLIANASDEYSYDVRIFHTSLSGKERRLLADMSTENVAVSLHNVSVNVSGIRDYSHSHYSAEMYYRLLIPEILSEYDKVVYLDCDLVLNVDVSELFRVDLEGRILAAVINDLVSDYMKSYLENTLHLSESEYFNSGVLVINCEEYRREGIKESCLSYLDSIERLQCPDQDILNLACQKSVLLLDREWNFQLGSGMYTRDECYAAPKRIIHFTSGKKPWNTKDLPLGEEFWKYADGTPFIEEIKEVYNSYTSPTPLKESGKEGQASENVDGEKKSPFSWPFRMLAAFFKNLGKIGFRRTMRKVAIKLKYVVNRLLGRVDKYNNPIISKAKEEKTDSISRYERLPVSAYPKELERWYNDRTGEKMDITSPVTFNQKIQWLKIHDATVIKSHLSDKWLAKEYIRKKLGEQYIIKTLGVYRSFEEIDFASLPDRFVIKSTHGSGQVILVRDKSKLDLARAKERIDRWLSTTYAFHCGFEMHYYNMIPRIIIEEYIDGVDGDLYDYKLMCIGGRVEFIWVDTDRHTGHRRNLYDREWNLLPVRYHHENSEKEIPRPDRLDEMIALAEELSRDFALVRCDFYVLPDGTLRFGELTFTSASGIDRWSPKSADIAFGEKVVLSKPTRFKKYSERELLALEQKFLDSLG